MTIISLTMLLIGIAAITKAVVIRIEANKLIKEKTLEAIQTNRNILAITTRAIESQIVALCQQRDSIDHLLAELEEQEMTCYEDEEGEEDSQYEEIIRCMRINNESLETTEDAIDRLESWYFMTYGRHYMKPVGIQAFHDENKNFSLN